MKKVLLYFFLFFYCISSSQSFYDEWNDSNGKYSKGFEHKNYFSLVGQIKEVEDTNEIILKVDSTNQNFESKIKRKFNRSGYLLKEYWVQKDSTLFLYQENTFDDKDNLILKTEYAKQSKRANDSIIFTGKLNSYQEKYTYNNEGKLLTKHQKRSYDNEFYISKRNTYKGGKLIKCEDLNNHIETSIRGTISCKGDGYSLNDFITKFEYNSNGLLIKTKKYINDSRKRYKDTIITMHLQDTITKDMEFSILIIRKENNSDFSKFNLEIEKRYHYDKQNRIILENTIDHHKSHFHSEDELSYEYWGNKKVKTVRKTKNGQISGHLNEYLIINKDTLLNKKWYLEGNKKLKESLGSEFLYNLDGSFKKSIYSNNKISRIQFYNSKNHLIEERDLRNNISRKINYEYDDKGNFIEKITLNDGIISEKITRKISYY